MIETIEKNIETEIAILKEVSYFSKKADSASREDKEMIEKVLGSLVESFRILNNSIPELLRGISLAKKLPNGNMKSDLEKITIERNNSLVEVVLSSKDKGNFLKELSISESYIRKLRKREKESEEKFEEFKGSRGYVKFANRFFFKMATKWTEKDYFKSLVLDLRKANIDVLFKSYVAMIFMTTFISFFLGVFIFVFLVFFDLQFIYPFVKIQQGNYFREALQLFWIPIVLPLLSFFSLYYYPTSERKAIGKKVDKELPFAVIHMSAISGSGIEPSEIFKIIGLNREYVYLRREIRKVINQINLYGYDLVSALNNASKTSPSENLAELFSGLSTTITSGADLSEFFEKRSENLLLNYRLEREKYTKLVETFLDIYISLVIAAPMIFLLLLVLMVVSGITLGFSSTQLSLIAISGIALLNFIFIAFLQIKQPSY